MNFQSLHIALKLSIFRSQFNAMQVPTLIAWLIFLKNSVTLITVRSYRPETRILHPLLFMSTTSFKKF